MADAYKKIIGDALSSVSPLPFKASELYARYGMDVAIPTAAQAKSGESTDRMKAGIEKSAKLKFDAVIGSGIFVSGSKYVKSEDRIAFKGKGLDTAEGKIADYIGRESRRAIVVDVPAGTEAKLNVLFVCDGSMPSEIAVVAGEGAKLNLLEWHASTAKGKAVDASVRAIALSKDSEVEIDTIHNDGANVAVGALCKAVVGDGATLRMSTVYCGPSETKATSIVEASGNGSRAQVREVAKGADGQRLDVNTFMVNRGKESVTHLRSGAVLKGRTVCTLKGYTKVVAGARDARADVEERGLMLDDKPVAKLLPDMSVDESSVRAASHSASTASVGGEPLFYLMSRGIGRKRAEKLFAAGFVSRYLDSVQNDIVKEVALSLMLDGIEDEKQKRR